MSLYSIKVLLHCYSVCIYIVIIETNMYKGAIMAKKKQKPTVQIDTSSLDDGINRFRVNSEKKRVFVNRCEKAGVTTTQAFRAFMESVNTGKIKLTGCTVAYDDHYEI